MFFAIQHSNDDARVLLWLMLKEGMQENMETKIVTCPELESEEFARIDPLSSRGRCDPTRVACDPQPPRGQGS